MLSRIISFSLNNVWMVILMVIFLLVFGIYSLLNIPIGAVPDVTNNQVQVITTSRSLSTEDIEKYITYPVELQMANLPGVIEIRSISKFGLSVVTVVFEDEMGTYLPRQLISEKLASADEFIPRSFGTPKMGPISTGLGEIYQYVLDVEPAYRDRYSITDLRTIQDWIVKRQLSGIPGVVEINTWGGYLKQYEVAVNPERLRSANVTLPELYSALEENNSIAGGGYIEKNKESFFIRGEGQITNLSEIKDIVIKTHNGLPLYVGDIAEVKIGAALRFGAITGNGEGEKVLGQVMMLKDASSNEVINRVRKEVEKLRPTLPEGIEINAFVDRSELIGRTTATIRENLILGCLIVIFVVVILLGNIRSGLIVASVIPLSLLFALSVMYLVGVDANLMSLGAIDFGIIIDGAVIIVEFVSFQLASRKVEFTNLPKKKWTGMIKRITAESTSRLMKSAIFGQLIIIIVFIPILSLSGIEGKMFRPMALTFCFALIGTMILCLTYVPVMCSLFIKPSNTTIPISVRFISWLKKVYEPLIRTALNYRIAILAVALVLLCSAGFLFTRLGGEFVPTLDEGDFVIQPVLKTGTSLTETVEIMTKIEQALQQFPEVDQVITRIGAAEVPTDPMSMEECDVIIRLTPKKTWSTAKTKDGLADAFKSSLDHLPLEEVEFTQPIEMRFNELITGVRSDLAIKIFGEDLEVLTTTADRIESLVKGVKGASDVTVEKVDGLPQMTVSYDRRRIARYGLNVNDLNRIIEMSFGGLPVGLVYEGERRFDLVMRLQPEAREDIENIRNLYIPLPGGGQIPFREVANIDYTEGPAKISRDDTQRRIVVGINVRNRDLESVVSEMQALIEQNIALPPGYTVDYGGQFQNLQEARDRLMVAVPIALMLIFILLYMAFGSFRETLLIYTAIPLSAVGGVYFLWLRSMPFSISAGVGFIALFGIAVLNGIVLIEHIRHLKSQGLKGPELIIRGTTERLRPVLLTATAAAMGFLPMAISTSAGAEVQRPLATVVIGGLISATILTLLVLPILYSYKSIGNS